MGRGLETATPLGAVVAAADVGGTSKPGRAPAPDTGVISADETGSPDGGAHAAMGPAAMESI